MTIAEFKIELARLLKKGSTSAYPATTWLMNSLRPLKR